MTTPRVIKNPPLVKMLEGTGSSECAASFPWAPGHDLAAPKHIRAWSELRFPLSAEPAWPGHPPVALPAHSLFMPLCITVLCGWLE